jgi:SET and MYND domain-containing protein 4
MFCSEECAKSSFKSFHQYECPLMEFILSSLLSSTMQMALRTFFVALTLFDESIESLEKFLAENQKPSTIFDCNFDDNKQKLLAINSLVFDEKIKVNEDIFVEIFNVSPVLKEMWSTHSHFISNFLRKQTQIATMNYHEIYSWPLKKGGLPDDDVNEFKGSLAYKRGVIATGNGSYPFCSLLNHSCSPNVSRIFVNEKIAVIVQRPIETGDQLFDNYGYNFTNVPKDDRQTELTRQYKFRCSCEACVNNWPILPGLKVVDKALLNKAKKACRELSLGGLNQKKAKDKYRELSEMIERTKKDFPTLEICSMMESAAAYLEMVTKPNVLIP